MMRTCSSRRSGSDAVISVVLMSFLLAATPRAVIVPVTNTGRVRSLPQFEVFEPIVCTNAVLVVYLLRSQKQTAQAPGHDQPMIHYIPVAIGHREVGIIGWNENVDITVPTANAPTFPARVIRPSLPLTLIGPRFGIAGNRRSNCPAARTRPT